MCCKGVFCYWTPMQQTMLSMWISSRITDLNAVRLLCLVNVCYLIETVTTSHVFRDWMPVRFNLEWSSQRWMNAEKMHTVGLCWASKDVRYASLAAVIIHTSNRWAMSRVISCISNFVYASLCPHHTVERKCLQLWTVNTKVGVDVIHGSC